MVHCVHFSKWQVADKGTMSFYKEHAASSMFSQSLGSIFLWFNINPWTTGQPKSIYWSFEHCFQRMVKPQGGRSRSITYHLLSKIKREGNIESCFFSNLKLCVKKSAWQLQPVNQLFPPLWSLSHRGRLLFWALWVVFSMRRHPSFKNHAHDNKMSLWCNKNMKIRHLQFFLRKK